ncbi:FliH/SctL family protein [Ignavibacterium sp.]|uniref:FliH/SctL family protein n=1 Tax=Ignavibacterium sp. TaxID=2651167 RepID=UPI00307D79D4
MSNVIKLNGKSARVNVKISEESFSPIENEKKDNTLEIELHNRYITGFNDGQKDAITKLQHDYYEKLKVKYEQLDTLLNQLYKENKSLNENFNKIVLETSFAVAEKIIRREVEKDSTIINLIENCLKKVLTANEILIRLNPGDFEVVTNDLKEINKSIDVSKIRFEKDEAIEKGGCLVETEIGNADARISSQLNELKRKLEEFNETEDDN